MPVTLKQMAYFQALAEELNFGRAATRVHISQPALSMQIKELEAALGVGLIERLPREIRLTPKEFQLLRYFVAHPNTTLSHRQLLQAVWGPDYGEELEYLRVFVNQLRKKIETNPARPKYLLTDPWAGYRFRPPE